MENDVSQQHLALYYPYIHIQDVDWLKATLLAFGQIKRMVPDLRGKRDTEEVLAFSDKKGPYGRLLEEANIHAKAVADAQRRLKSKIEANLSTLVSMYSQRATEGQGAKFRIHRGKLLQHEGEDILANLLEKHELAWSEPQGDNEDEFWLTVHTKVGCAIMSTLALAVARNEGLAIVTSDADIHQTLLANREADVFNVLLGLPASAPGSNEQVQSKDEYVVDDVIQIIITTNFDASKLSPEKIADLHGQGKDLSKFRKAVDEICSDVPADMGPEARKKTLQRKADEIVKRWNSFREDLPEFAKDVFQEIVTAGGKEVLAAAATGAPLAIAAHAAAPAVAVAIVTGVGVGVYRHKTNPINKFLNRVRKVTKRSSEYELFIPQFRIKKGYHPAQSSI